MGRLVGSLRRLLIAPSLRSVTFAARGFEPSEAAVTVRLESIPQAVIVGLEAALEARDLQEIQWRFGLVDEELRGFAYEGATMALTILDQLLPGRGTRTRQLLLGPAAPYAFLTYIGLGFAMARLPRARWARILPDLTGSAYYPGLSWLAVDGYGFDLAFFNPRRWVERQQVPRPYPWLGSPEYFPRAVDQGIGRALWFIHGARVPDVGLAVERFPADRRPDLWSGVGLAAAFAGGAGEADLKRLRVAAEGHRADLAQGTAFAAKARTFAGLVPQHTEVAVNALAGLTACEGAKVVDAAVAATRTSEPQMAYEGWRTNVRQHFARFEHTI